ncbi:MAG TPA: hypothetical protein VFO89_05720, partial [Thermoanaerobaculia bacterium]|nr:hypothetical protein [Thermoanaerobaculia bacterium]
MRRVLLAMTLFVSALQAQTPEGSRGVLFIPNDESIDGCTVHFLKADYKKPDSRYPCGTWFTPEPGDHIV